jgi:hypothetical protein
MVLTVYAEHGNFGLIFMVGQMITCISHPVMSEAQLQDTSVFRPSLACVATS